MAALPESVSKAWEDRKGPAIFTTADENGMVLESGPLIRHLAERRAVGHSSGALALAFHDALCYAICTVCRRLRDERGIGTVALSGGCFQNRLLLTSVLTGLEENGFRVLTHEQTPPNDGCVALGQAAVAAARLAACGQ